MRGNLTELLAMAFAALPEAEQDRKLEAMQAGRQRLTLDQQTGEVVVWVEDEVLVRTNAWEIVGAPQPKVLA
jgi:hypothetical protein